MSNSPQPPVQKFKLRGVEVAVWAKHDDEKGTRYTTSVQKSYWDKNREEYVNSNYFFPEESAILALLLQRAVTWIAETKEKPGGKVWSGDDQSDDNVEKPF